MSRALNKTGPSETRAVAGKPRSSLQSCRPAFILPSSSAALRSLLASLVALFICLAPVSSVSAFAQGKGATTVQKNRRTGARSHESSEVADLEMIEQAIGAVCSEREADPHGSVPIDEMQSRPSLPLNHPDVVAGARRAERLLPVARELTISALGELVQRYDLPAVKMREATLRINAVREIEPDMELRDNASVVLSNPRAINFGTIFLAGLPSDEGMVSVLAHELVHIADGKTDALRPLFRQIGRRAATLTGLSIYGHRPEELTSDLVGAMATRALIASTTADESLARRSARAVEHNCVEEDDTDEDHLSPRNTMRAVFALVPPLVRDVMSNQEFFVPLKNPRRQSLQQH